jgi:hypothetical protein
LRLTLEIAEKELAHISFAADVPTEPKILDEKENVHTVKNKKKCKPDTQLKPSDHPYLVTLNHVQKAIQMIFGSPLVSIVSEINLHGQLILVTLNKLELEQKEAEFNQVVVMHCS